MVCPAEREEDIRPCIMLAGFVSQGLLMLSCPLVLSSIFSGAIVFLHLAPPCPCIISCCPHCLVWFSLSLYHQLMLSRGLRSESSRVFFHTKPHISVREQTNILVFVDLMGCSSCSRGDKDNYSKAITECRETPDLCIASPFKCLMSH